MEDNLKKILNQDINNGILELTLDDNENEKLDAELRNQSVRVIQRWHSGFSFRQIGFSHGFSIVSPKTH